MEGQRLYSYVAGSDIELMSDDIAAINHCLDTEGCALHEKLINKSMISYGIPNSNMTYLRITIGCDIGDSPGVPFVLELWPKYHYSPIHTHGDAVAVIKILHGNLTSNYYNPLPRDRGENWLPEPINQVHMEYENFVL